jgi:hypothetical protein
LALKGANPVKFGLLDSTMAFDSKVELEEAVQAFCEHLFDSAHFTKTHTGSAPPANAENVCHSVRVSCPRAEVSAFAAWKFHVDHCSPDKGWNKPIVRRCMFETEMAMPSALSIVLVSRVDEVLIAKVEFCEMKFETLLRKLRMTFKNVKSLLPPRKAMGNPKQLLHTVSPWHLIMMLRKIKEVVPPRRSHDCFLKCAFCSAWPAAPESITDLTHDRRFHSKELDVLQFYRGLNPII